MKPCITPTEEVLIKATKLGFKARQGSTFFLNDTHMVGLLVNRFKHVQVEYLGTITILKCKIRKSLIYHFLESNYRGKCIKTALKILGTKRVRVFCYKSGTRGKSEVILFGTKDGTVGIAPLVNIKNEDSTPIPFSKISKFPSSKMARKIVYDSI